MLDDRNPHFLTVTDIRQMVTALFAFQLHKLIIKSAQSAHAIKRGVAADNGLTVVTAKARNPVVILSRAHACGDPAIRG